MYTYNDLDNYELACTDIHDVHNMTWKTIDRQNLFQTYWVEDTEYSLLMDLDLEIHPRMLEVDLYNSQ